MAGLYRVIRKNLLVVALLLTTGLVIGCLVAIGPPTEKLFIPSPAATGQQKAAGDQRPDSDALLAPALPDTAQ